MIFSLKIWWRNGVHKTYFFMSQLVVPGASTRIGIFPSRRPSPSIRRSGARKARRELPWTQRRDWSYVIAGKAALFFFSLHGFTFFILYFYLPLKVGICLKENFVPLFASFLLIYWFFWFLASLLESFGHCLSVVSSFAPRSNEPRSTARWFAPFVTRRCGFCSNLHSWRSKVFTKSGVWLVYIIGIPFLGEFCPILYGPILYVYGFGVSMTFIGKLGLACLADQKLGGQQSRQPEEGTHQGDPGERWHYNREGQPLMGCGSTTVCHLISIHFTSHHGMLCLKLQNHQVWKRRTFAIPLKWVDFDPVIQVRSSYVGVCVVYLHLCSSKAFEGKRLWKSTQTMKICLECVGNHMCLPSHGKSALPHFA